MTDDRTAGTPWDLWVVGILSLLWNAMGAADYTLTNLRNEWWLSLGEFTPEQIAWFTSFPAWAHAAWAFGVWGAVLGSIALLIRNRLAVLAFAVSLLGLVCGTVYKFGLGGMPAGLNTPGTQAFTTVLWVVAIALLWYAMRMKARGVLR